MWTKRDWISIMCGWIGGTLAAMMLPEDSYKFVLVFATGFVAAWTVRGLLPR